ncbi:hypothetical protein IQ06DRAFT_352285 [Phaeosphaeriaceae sp. SRC1lsM3a]|nr:hypothetical protein IQ06DRAFT_352285 [Stagonospora sp. SRC1lsM3a]
MSTNSTTNIVSWAPNPDGRGTIDLLWSCFATVFLCTWSAIHPNLPALGEKGSRIFFRRLSYVLGCIIAPECYAALALWELSVALNYKAQTPGWSLRQCFFLHMGGFVVQSTPQQTERFRLHPDKLFSMFKSGALPWPVIAEDEITSRSRADWFTKGITMVQILYFVTSLLGRWAQGLATTTLELFTLGLVVSAIITLVALWKKPFDVQVPIVLFNETSFPKEDCINRVLMSSLDDEFGEIWWVNVGGIVTCVAFGALHIAAWNFYFPSPTERLLWRISSVFCTVLLSCIMPFARLNEASHSRFDGVMFVLFAVYILLRTYMFAEMFASLRAVPENVYQTPEWSQYFPFLG